MEISSDKDLGNNLNNNKNNSAILPSLFGNHAVAKDGLLVLNDNSLTQQIEFILQEAPMDDTSNEHHTLFSTTPPHYKQLLNNNNNHSNNNNNIKSNNNINNNAVNTMMVEKKTAQSIAATIVSTTNKTNNNNNVTLNPPNNCASDNKNIQQQQQQHLHEQITNNNNNNNNNSQQQQQIQQVLNGRRIIIQSTRQVQQQQHNLHLATQISCAQHVGGGDVEEDEEDLLLEDPELNDENLQDIEEETQESEAELQNVDEHLPHHNNNNHNQQQQQQYQTVRQIKLEYETNEPVENTIQYISSNNANNTATQLMLPSGTIVSTTSATSTPNVMPALTSLQRRPVYIREVSTNADGATIVSMPSSAVIKNGPMTLVNLVQAADGQLLQQTGSTPTSIGTSVVVATSPNVSIVPLQTMSTGQVFTTLNGNHSNNNNNHNTSVIGMALANNNNNNCSNGTALSQEIDGKKSNSGNNNNKKLIKKSIAIKAAVEVKANGGGNDANSAISTGAYQCIDCPERFDAKDIFDIHRSGHLNNMKCAICNMVLKSLKNYEKHCLRCKPYECQICGRIVRFRPNFIKHMRVHTACQAAERHKYKCEVCHKEFMSFEYFKVHKKIHSENVNLTCEICGKVFSALASLRGHSKLHSGHKLHKCEVCGKGFGQRYNLKIHARTHTGDFPYECSTCKKKLHTEKALETHMKMHQRQMDNNNTSQQLSRNRLNSKNKPKTIVARPTLNATENNNINNNNNNNINNNVRYERPSTSGLQQLCAIASDNLKNFNSQIDSTTMNDTTDGNTLTSNALDEYSNDSTSISMSQQQQQYNNNDNDDDDDDEELLNNNNNHINNNSAEGLNIGDEENENYNDDDDNDDNDDDDDDEPTTSIRAPARTIVINNFVQNNNNINKKESNVNSVPTSNAINVITQSGQFKNLQQQQQLPPPQKHHQIIQHFSNTSTNDNCHSVLKQQLMRKTPIIQTAAISSSSYIVQDTGTANSLNAPSVSRSSTMVITSTGTVAGLGTSIIGNIDHSNNYTSAVPSNIMSINNSNNNNHLSPHEAAMQPSNNHRNHHQSPDREVSLDVDDDAHVMDAHDIVHHTADGNSCNSVMANDNATIMPISAHQVPTIHNQHHLHHQHHNQHHQHHHLHKKNNGEHFDDDTNDDDKSSPSLATTAIIKQEPNFYNSGSVDNSNEMLIKEEVIFEDSTAAHSPRSHSPLSSKYCMTNFDTDHHGGPMDLNHSLPPYGHLFESHSIPDSIPFARIDDDDFQLDHSSLSGLHNASNSTTDGEFIKKEWVYGAGNNFNMNSKFDEDTDPMCESASFIYN